MSNELNFYEVGAYGYEECIEKQYYSYGYYQQEEFERILFDVMKELMEDIVKSEPSSLCYYNIFFSPDDLLLHERFDELMEGRGFFRLKNKINVRVGFELDNRYENQYNKDLINVFKSLDIDESCIDDDCSRIRYENKEEKEYCRKKCGVTIRRE